MRPIIFLLVSFTLIAQAQAVPMREAIEECHYDGRKNAVLPYLALHATFTRLPKNCHSSHSR